MLKCEYRRVKKTSSRKHLNQLAKSIAIRLTSTDLNGEDVIAITKSQLGRLMKAYEAKKGMTIKMSRSQMDYNLKIEGGFLTMPAGLIPFLTGTVLSALGVLAL